MNILIHQWWPLYIEVCRMVQQSSCFNDFVSLAEILSYALIWVKHNSHSGTHGSSSDVLGEWYSDGTSVAVSVDNFSPAASESSIIYCVFDLVHICNSFTKVPSGALFISAVLNRNESLIHYLSDSVSSKSCENTLLIESDWLSLVVLLLLLCFCLLFCHSSLFVIKIIQYILKI